MLTKVTFDASRGGVKRGIQRALTGHRLLEHASNAALGAGAGRRSAGDLPAARRLAERLRDLPFYREEGHLATARLLLVTVLAGDWTEAVGLAEQFREGWERAGRPRAGNLSRGAYAAATWLLAPQVTADTASCERGDDRGLPVG